MENRSNAQRLTPGGTPIFDLDQTGMLVVTLGVEIVDPVTFRVTGRKKSKL